MRQISTREKAFIGIGAVAAVGMIVWFIVLPMLENDGSGQKSSLSDMQERLAAVQNLASISPMLLSLEDKIGEQSGYKKISFKRGSTNPKIINFIAQTASSSGIGELDQLDARPDTSRRSRATTINQQDILKSIADQLYMGHVIDEVEGEMSVPDEESDLDAPEESEDAEKVEELDEPTDEISDQAEEAFEPDLSEEPDKPMEEEPEEQPDLADSKTQIFPPVPKDIPDEVKKSMADYIKRHQGKTLALSDINPILEDAEIDDESEGKRIRKRIQSHSGRVKEKKREMVMWLNNVGISQTTMNERISRYNVKMVFKTKMDPLVKFLYNLQDSAKWLKVESMRIGISDRKETTLSVDLTMTAIVIFGLGESE